MRACLSFLFTPSVSLSLFILCPFFRFVDILNKHNQAKYGWGAWKHEHAEEWRKYSIHMHVPPQEYLLVVANKRPSERNVQGEAKALLAGLRDMITDLASNASAASLFSFFASLFFLFCDSSLCLLINGTGTLLERQREERRTTDWQLIVCSEHLQPQAQKKKDRPEMQNEPWASCGHWPRKQQPQRNPSTPQKPVCFVVPRLALLTCCGFPSRLFISGFDMSTSISYRV